MKVSGRDGELCFFPPRREGQKQHNERRGREERIFTNESEKILTDKAKEVSYFFPLSRILVLTCFAPF